MKRRVFEIRVPDNAVAAMSVKWVCVQTPDGKHIVPILDMRKHEDHHDCWCEPKVSGRVVTHNSLDGREAFEEGQRMRS